MGVEFMDIRQLKTFKTIVDCGGFTKAAEYLGYAQSTITFHIKCLEQEVGEPVFDRVGKKVLLTESGKSLMPNVIKMLNIYKEITEGSTINSDMRGELTLTAPEALLTYRLPPVIKEFKETYPNIDIQLKHLDPLKLREDITQGNIDLAFVIDTEKEYNGIYFEKVIDESMMLISSDFFPLNEENQFKNRVFLFTEEGCIYRKTFETLLFGTFNSGLINYGKGIEFWSIEALKECVKCGLGISVLPYIVIERELLQHQIFAQEIKTASTISTYLAYHEEKWLSPSFRAFLDILRKHSGLWEEKQSMLKSELKTINS
jgi:DNA-binding transcriptional LysR family regulator